MIASTRFAYDTLQDPTKIPEISGPIVIYGESLGAAVALGLIEDLATTQNPAHTRPNGVVLEAPFSSITDLAKATVGDIGRIAPIFLDSWTSEDRAGEFLTLPLLVVHGKDDRVVPILQGQAVYDAAKSKKKRILCVAGANHVNLWSSGVLTQVFGHMAAKDLGL